MNNIMITNITIKILLFLLLSKDFFSELIFCFKKINPFKGLVVGAIIILNHMSLPEQSLQFALALLHSINGVAHVISKLAEL